MKKIIIASIFTIVFFSLSVFAQIPIETLVKISRAEDELRYDKTLENLIKNPNPKIQIRAMLAAGRIGDERAVPVLAEIVTDLVNPEVNSMAAFALGEIESIKGADAILTNLTDSKLGGKARAIEAAGKIAAANPKEEISKKLGEAILKILENQLRYPKQQEREIVLLGLTAILRARPENGDFVAAKFLTNLDARIRADAANTLTRLRAKNANEQARKLLQKDTDAIVRANAARVLGAAEDKDAFDLLLNAAINDKDSRVRVSAIRAVGSLKDAKAADKLLERGEKLLTDYKKSKFANPVEKNELLEIATALGNLLKDTDDEKSVEFLVNFRDLEKFQSPEIDIALAKIKPKDYVENVVYPFTEIALRLNAEEDASEKVEFDWRVVSSVAQGITVIADLDAEKNKEHRKMSLDFLSGLLQGNTDDKKFYSETNALAFPAVLSAFAKFKTDDLTKVLTEYLKHKDLFIRATAAELLGDQPAAKENIEALKTAFAESLKTDKQYNDAQLAILSALVKLDKPQSFESLRLALTAPDYLVRKHAANLIKQNDLTKDFSNIEKMVGSLKPYNAKTGTKQGQVLNSEADYRRAVSRKNGSVKAVLTTEKGKFTIDLLPEDAPLTVDNFIKLARSNYFNGVSVHRVVPNFVMQDGDPRGDGNGGPGYSIRCEINMIPYERGAVGMALSGKDTGGSQWFVTHSPQPHLDGGYTVFGRVNETDMKVVDSIVRGDKILKVEIVEGKSPKK